MKVLLGVEEEIVERNDKKSQEELNSSTVIKDTIRGSAIKDILILLF